MNSESLYWLFSAAAQSIAALIAFLLAGIALAFSMMDRISEQDETLIEVIEALKDKQHKTLAALSVSTGVAIMSSLLSVYMNPSSSQCRDSIMIFAGIADTTVIILAIYFVVSITSPGRYARAARREYLESKNEIESVAGQEPSSAFFKEFILLEQDIRDFLRRKKLYVPSRGAPKMSFSFRQMVDALYQNEIIPGALKDEFYTVNKFRNLLFHGHIGEVDEGVIVQLRATIDKWNSQKNAQPANQADGN